jgi:hypothetical protein
MNKDQTLSTVHEENTRAALDRVDAKRPRTGQLGTFALLGGAAGSVPVPFLPTALRRRVRGALVQDIVARHGLALSPDARAVLADPSAGKSDRGAVGQAFGYLGKKLLVRFGPLAFLPAVRAALETYVLGHLLDRYLCRRGADRPARVDAAEAHAIRDAIHDAVLRVIRVDREVRWPTTPVAPDDARDEVTQALDGLFSVASTVPSWLIERLDAAFDETPARR